MHTAFMTCTAQWCSSALYNLALEITTSSSSMSAFQATSERIMDSNDLERERGITILAKNTAVSKTGML